jgi:DNA-binding MarR family transcriptional regulator
MVTQADQTSSAAASTIGDHGDGSENRAFSKDEFERVANFRYSLRRLLRQTELEAARYGITPQHYQLLLAIKGYPNRDWASITELAERLQIRHNAVIGLVNRAEARGLLERWYEQTPGDRRVVQIHLTSAGEAVLRQLTSVLRSERERVTSAVSELAQDVENDWERPSMTDR